MNRGMVAIVGALLVVVAGCGNEAGSRERVPITSRAIAAVMLDHLGDDTSRREATYVDEHSPPGYVGADFRYHAGEGDDGDLVRVSVERGSKVPACSEGYHCATLTGGVHLAWQLEEPEEDPGIVDLTYVRQGTLVTAVISGPTITGDPRRQELTPSVEDLVDLVKDPRLAVRTTRDVVDAGTKVGKWKGGERDPAEFDRVRNTDQTVVTGFVFAFEHGWKYVGPSPYKRLFGSRAVGGRVSVSKELTPVGPGYVDVLATPETPTWLTNCLPRYRCWTHGPEHFAWRPTSASDPGDSFLLYVAKDGETVAIHVQGPRMPAKRGEALAISGYYLWGQDFARAEDSIEPWAIGYTTTREHFENAKKLTHG